MQRSLHACSVALVIALDVVERGLAYGVRIGGGLRAEYHEWHDGEQKHCCTYHDPIQEEMIGHSRPATDNRQRIWRDLGATRRQLSCAAPGCARHSRGARARP